MFVVGVFIVPSAEFIFFLIWQSVLRGQHCIRAVFHQADSFEYSLKFLLQSSYLECQYIFIFAKFSYTQRNPVMKNFKTKNRSPYHLGNSNNGDVHENVAEK